MSQIDTKYDVGDVVYTATRYGYDKGIIKALKITGPKRRTVLYGFELPDSWMTWLIRDDYTWYHGDDVFDNIEAAGLRHFELRDKAAAEEKKRHAIQRATDLAEARERVKQLEQGIEVTLD